MLTADKVINAKNSQEIDFKALEKMLGADDTTSPILKAVLKILFTYVSR